MPEGVPTDAAVLVGDHLAQPLPEVFSAAHLRRRCQLIEKENAFACGGEKLGRHPFGLVFGDPRQTPKIDRVKLHSPHVEKVVVEIVGDLRDDLRLPNATRAPDVQGHTFGDQRMKRLIEFRWFHELSSVGWKWAGIW